MNPEIRASNIGRLISVIVTIIAAFYIGKPSKYEPFLEKLFELFPGPPGHVNIPLLMALTVVGTIVFILSVIGRFEEHKIGGGFKNLYAKQINILRHSYYLSSTYILYMVLIIFTETSFVNQIVKDNLQMMVYCVAMTTSLLLLMIIAYFMVIKDLLSRLGYIMEKYGIKETEQLFGIE